MSFIRTRSKRSLDYQNVIIVVESRTRLNILNEYLNAGFKTFKYSFKIFKPGDPKNKENFFETEFYKKNKIYSSALMSDFVEPLNNLLTSDYEHSGSHRSLTDCGISIFLVVL